ncbi:MAG: lamin tail domain-containing protein [Bacteroidales bacterium]
MRVAITILVVFLPHLVFSQGLINVWNEDFNYGGIGYWGGGQNMPDSLAWTMNVGACSFASASDYVKTVSTRGGRLEARNCNGEALWISDTIFISSDSLILSLDVMETGSGNNVLNKYVSVHLNIDGISYGLSQNKLLQGNFGHQTIEHPFASSKFCIISINILTGYSNDKLIIDNILLQKYQETEAQVLKITSIPLVATRDESFIIKAIAADTLGNQATSFNGTANIKELNLSTDISKGKAMWDNVQISSTGLKRLNFSTYNQNITCRDSLMIVNRLPNLISDNFNYLDTNIWQADTSWIIASKNGKSMLQHNASSKGNTSQLWTKPININIDHEAQWSIEFQNGDWDPSSSNKFNVVLLADSASNSYSGVACGVNIKNSNDLLELWQIERGRPIKLLSSLRLDVNANMKCTIYAGKDASDTWWLCAQDSTGNRFMSYGEQYSPKFPDRHSGLIFRHSPTRKGLLYFDNFKINGSKIPFALKNITVISEGKLLLSFNEPLAEQDLSNLTKLVNNKDKPLNIITFTRPNPSSIELTFDNNNADYLLTMHLQDIKSVYNNSIDSTLQVSIAIPPKAGRLIISEICAQPDSSSPLPNSEYVEIINMGNFPILLDSCHLQISNRSAVFQNDTIFPNQYKVLTSIVDSSLWKDYEDVILLASMPSLSNTGTSISIYNADNDSISSIEYSNKWHATTAQRKGWALERRDLYRDCGQKYNWTTSTAAKQGSPTKINSVDAENKDSIKPKLLAWEVTSNQELKFIFSEAMQALSNDAILKIINNTIDSISWTNDSILHVAFKNNIPINQKFTVSFNPDLSDLCNNEMLEYSVEILNRKIEENELFISEILYNPYSGAAEFIELYNNSTLEISLKDITLAIGNSSVSFDEDLSMQPKGFYMLTKDVESVAGSYYTPIYENCFEVNIPSLPNSGATIEIFNKEKELIAESSYSDDMHSQLIYNTKGVSLSIRCVECHETTLISSSSIDGYATPTYFSESSELVKNEYSLTPKVFSPDNDGSDDMLRIGYSTSIGGHSANIRIYNSQGREIVIIANNEYVSGNGDFTWNGCDWQGNMCKSGVYIVIFELYNDRGDKVHKKLACTLIRRK